MIKPSKPLMHINWLLLICTVLPGCALLNNLGYEAGQAKARAECANLSDSQQRSDCYYRNGKSYDDYQAERAKLTPKTGSH